MKKYVAADRAKGLHFARSAVNYARTTAAPHRLFVMRISALIPVAARNHEALFTIIRVLLTLFATENDTANRLRWLAFALKG